MSWEGCGKGTPLQGDGKREHWEKTGSHNKNGVGGAWECLAGSGWGGGNGRGGGGGPWLGVGRGCVWGGGGGVGEREVSKGCGWGGAWSEWWRGRGRSSRLEGGAHHWAVKFADGRTIQKRSTY